MECQSDVSEAVHPQELLTAWLGLRLEPGTQIERFISGGLPGASRHPGLPHPGERFPESFMAPRHKESWGKPRPIDTIVGMIHGDLNTNNILVKFADNKEELEGTT